MRRGTVLALALVATVAVSIWAAYLPDDELTPTLNARHREPIRVAHQGRPVAPATPAAPTSAPLTPRANLALAARTAPSATAADVFDGDSWTKPPPAPAAPPTPPPQLPFTYSGRMEVAGKESFLLLEGARTHIVPLGAEVQGFRLESTDPQSLNFLHVATKQRVSLALKP
jgi:hypothetical protein